MSFAPVGIAVRDWEAKPAPVRCLLLEVLEQNQLHNAQLEALAIRIAQLEEQRGRNSGNSSKPPSSDGPGQKGFGGGGGRRGKPGAMGSVAVAAASRGTPAMAATCCHLSVVIR